MPTLDYCTTSTGRKESVFKGYNTIVQGSNQESIHRSYIYNYGRQKAGVGGTT